MPKKPNHTACRKKTFLAMKRKRLLRKRLKEGTLHSQVFTALMNMPLKKWWKAEKDTHVG